MHSGLQQAQVSQHLSQPGHCEQMVDNIVAHSWKHEYPELYASSCCHMGLLSKDPTQCNWRYWQCKVIIVTWHTEASVNLFNIIKLRSLNFYLDS